LFDTTPVAYGLHQIYKKRWISRYWQECGVKVWADLNVAKKFQKWTLHCFLSPISEIEGVTQLLAEV